MARVKGGLNAKKKHNRVLKLAKGYRGARSKQFTAILANRVKTSTLLEVQFSSMRSSDSRSATHRLFLQSLLSPAGNTRLLWRNMVFPPAHFPITLETHNMPISSDVPNYVFVAPKTVAPLGFGGRIGYTITLHCLDAGAVCDVRPAKF